MQPDSASTFTLSAALTSYLDWHALRGSSTHHRRELRRILGGFAQDVGPDQPVTAVTREDCERLLRTIQERQCKPNTQEAYYRVLDAFFHWLVKEERLADTPMRRVPRPRLPQEPIRPLTAEEVGLLLAQPDRKTFTGLRDLAFMGLLVDTGLRVSEALNLQVGDLDFKVRSVSVMGKGGKARVVFYGEAAARLLQGYLKRRGKVSQDDLLFVNSLGERMLRFAMAERVHHYGETAGIRGKRVSPHTLRHTFAISWLLGGGDTLSLQRLLGHATPTMTSRYVNFATDDLARLHRSVSPLDRLKGGDSDLRSEQGERRRRLR